jgi:hypothetical protein
VVVFLTVFLTKPVWSDIGRIESGKGNQVPGKAWRGFCSLISLLTMSSDKGTMILLAGDCCCHCCPSAIFGSRGFEVWGFARSF